VVFTLRYFPIVISLIGALLLDIRIPAEEKAP